MKRILLIGASSGIGKEMALLYAAKGHTVGITGRRQALLEDIRSQFPQNIFTACFDVNAADNVSSMHRLIEQLGGIDVLIYNAGFGDPSTGYNTETEVATTKTNVLGCVELVGSAFTYFLQKGSGQLAITSSVAALRGNSWAPAYSASKAFASNFAEGLNIKARRLKKKIVVTDIRPGFIDTAMAKGNGRFWVASPKKAATQMVAAIEKKKRVAYITRRWWLVAQVMKWIPFWLYRRIV